MGATTEVDEAASGSSAPRLRRIVVGLDGSPNAAYALEWVIALAARFDAEVVAVHAVGLLSSLGGGPPVPSHLHRAELRRAFEEQWCAPLRASGVRYRARLVDGPPVLVLLRTVSEEDADAAVVGSRGIGGFAELLLGSTSHQLAEHSDRPVLIVPYRPAAGGTDAVPPPGG